MPHLNLIPAHRSLDAARRRRFERWTFVGIAYGLMVLAGSGLLTVAPAATTDNIAPQLDSAERRLAETQSRITSLRHQLATAERTASAQANIGTQPNWAGLLMLLAQTAGDNVVLTQCQGEPPRGVTTAKLPSHPRSRGYIVRLVGFGKSQADVSSFVLQLEHSTLFDTAKLTSTRLEVFENVKVVAFELECHIGLMEDEE